MEMISLQMPDELLKTTRRCAKSLQMGENGVRHDY